MARGITAVRRALSDADRAARNASREGVRPGSGKSGNRGDTPEFAERDRRAAAERARTRANQEQARATEKRGAISNVPVSATSVRRATTIQEVNMRRRQVEDMPDGRDKSTLLDLLDQQERQIRDMDSADADRASRLSAQAARDRTVNTKENVTLPKMPFAKGGMAKKYNKGGYANCGASMKPDGKRRK